MSEPGDVLVEAADGTRIAIHRLPRAVRHEHATPVLLVPGTFSTRTLWLGTRGQGFGRFLAAAGFDVWIVELRGHGASDRPRRWTMQEWIRHDAPAAIEAVLVGSGASGCFWVGHSAGGVVGAAVLGHRPALARGIRGLVLLGAPGPALRGFRRAGARAAFLAASMLPWTALPGRPFRLGPEPEHTALLREWMHWNLLGLWRAPGGGDYLHALGDLDVPLLAIAGAGDRVLAPPDAAHDLVRRFGSRDCTFVVAGRRHGFHADYGHAALLTSRAARDDIWPLVREWLAARQPAARSQPQP